MTQEQESALIWKAVKTMLAVMGAVALLMSLVACGGGERPEPEIRTVEVQVPVYDPACVREVQARLGPEPEYPDTPEAIAAAPDLFERVKLILAGRVLRSARLVAYRAALEECDGD